MLAYSTNKILSLATIVGSIFVLWHMFGYTTDQWQRILYAILILGYAHFFVGWWYQLKSFARAPSPMSRYRAFMFLVIVSLVLTYALIIGIGFLPALFIGSLYFLFHGLLNEQTLLERQGGVHVSLIPLTALSVVVIGVMLYAVPDQTFFFEPDLTFQVIPEFLITLVFKEMLLDVAYFPLFFFIAVAIAAILFGYSVWNKITTTATTIIAGITACVTLGIVLFGPPPYIYIYFLIVGYHFMTWLLFYLVTMYKRGIAEWRTFLYINGSVFSCLCIAAYLHHDGNLPILGDVMFDYRTFAALTYVHITTSFMNDAWWISLERRLFG